MDSCRISKEYLQDWCGDGYEAAGIEALRKYCEDCYAPERKRLGLE